ncbi:MAG: TolC family protein [Bacteroidetes bacterium]|nr:TolC family protein [Bacteroidota bacterium]
MRSLLLILSAITALHAGAQPADTAAWTLQRAIDHALANNIQVKKAVLTEQSARYDLDQQKYNRLPSVSANGALNVSNGNAVDPITSDFVNQNILSNSYGISGQVSLYQGGKLNLLIEQNERLVAQSALYREQAENSIVLNVLQGYLQTLYYNEGVAMARNALTSADAQLALARVKFDNGAIAQLDLAELQSAQASATYSVTTAENQYRQQLLQLKQLLELDPSVDFRIQPVALADLQPAIPDQRTVFAAAAAALPDLKIYEEQEQILNTALDISRAGHLPTLSLNAGISTGYTNTRNYGFDTQLNNNLSPQAGLTLSIPLFSKFQNRTNVAKAKIEIEQITQDRIAAGKSLYSTIENAWQNATASQAQQTAAEVSSANAELAYSLAAKKLEFGGLTASELTVSRNSYLSAEQSLLQARYLTSLYTMLLQFYQGTLTL